MHTLKPWHSPKRWCCSPKSLAKPFHAEELNEQPYLAPAPPSSQELGEANKPNSTPWNAADQRKLPVPDQKACINAVLPAAPSPSSEAEMPAVVAHGESWCFIQPTSSHMGSCKRQDPSWLLLETAEAKGKTLERGTLCSYSYSSQSAIKYQELRFWVCSQRLLFKKRRFLPIKKYLGFASTIYIWCCHQQFITGETDVCLKFHFQTKTLPYCTQCPTYMTFLLWDTGHLRHRWPIKVSPSGSPVNTDLSASLFVSDLHGAFRFSHIKIVSRSVTCKQSVWNYLERLQEHAIQLL